MSVPEKEKMEKEKSIAIGQTSTITSLLDCPCSR